MTRCTEYKPQIKILCAFVSKQCALFNRLLKSILSNNSEICIPINPETIKRLNIFPHPHPIN